jgi:HK97 family phage portal protein
MWSTSTPNSLVPWLQSWWRNGQSFNGGQNSVGSASRCLELVSQEISTMPLRFRGNYEPMWVSNPDPVWFPNGIGDALFAAVWSLYAWGDAFLWTTSRYEDSGYPRNWTVLDPAQVTVEADPSGGRSYRVGELELAAENMLQISRNPSGQLRGTSALAGYASNLAAASAAEAFAADVFVAGGVPWAVLQPQRRITAEQAAELQAQWVARSGTRGAAPAVIPPDVTFTQFSFSPKDLLLLESREWDAKQIAAAFGVPAFMLNLPQADGLNYSNPEMLFTTWLRSELYPKARRVEAALSLWLPRGNWVEFDPSFLTRPDLQTMSAVVLASVQAGVLSPDEGRAMLWDLPPLAQGEALAMIDEPSGASTSEAVAATPTVAELEAMIE